MEINSFSPVIYTPLEPADRTVTPVAASNRSYIEHSGNSAPIHNQGQIAGQFIIQNSAQRFAGDLSEKAKTALQAYNANAREQQRQQLSKIVGVDEFA